MTPPVRGRQKATVATLLAFSATATGALAGFAGGIAWAGVAGFAGATGLAGVGSTSLAPLMASSRGGVVVLVVAAVAGDLAFARWGAPRPLAVGRQVPQVWSRMFSPPAVAVLYGARLGVGPLTILPTWLWWAMFLLAAVLGPAVGALAGAVFGLVRGGSMVVTAEWLRGAAPVRIARLRAWEPRIAALVAPLALAGLLLV